MKAIVNRTEFARELTMAAGCVSRKATVPILGCVLITASDDAVEITSTNLDVAFRSRISASVSKPGAVAIPARKLAQGIKLLPSETIELATEKDSVTARSGRAILRLGTMSEDSFPALQAAPVTEARMSTTDLVRALGRVQFAICKEESRFTLNAALLDIANGTCKAVATDGHRLALCSVRAESAAPLRFLLSCVAIPPLLRICGTKARTAECAHSDGHVFFTVGQRAVISRVGTGKFPDYEKVFPREMKYSAVIESCDLRESLRRAMCVADPRSNRVNFEFNGSSIALSAGNETDGRVSDELPAEIQNGSVTVALSGAYVSDFMRVVKSDRCAIQMPDKVEQGSGGALFYPVGDEGYRYLVMPQRI